MKTWTLATLAITLAATTAHADTGTSAEPRGSRYLGASVELSNGLVGQSELGFAVQAAPLRQLELEVGAIRHDVEGKESDVWLATAMARAKLAFRHGAVFVGVGVVTGEHGASNGCTSTGFIDFCGGADTFVQRHWARAVWLRSEMGGEVSMGPVALRFAVAPMMQFAEPDMESGCLECDDGSSGALFTMGLHGRLPL